MATKKKTKMTTKKVARLGDEGRGLGGEGRGLGGEGRGRGRGSRCRCISSPRYIFFQCFLYILVTFFTVKCYLRKEQPWAEIKVTMMTIMTATRVGNGE